MPTAILTKLNFYQMLYQRCVDLPQAFEFYRTSLPEACHKQAVFHSAQIFQINHKIYASIETCYLFINFMQCNKYQSEKDHFSKNQ